MPDSQDSIAFFSGLRVQQRINGLKIREAEWHHPIFLSLARIEQPQALHLIQQHDMALLAVHSLEITRDRDYLTINQGQDEVVALSSDFADVSTCDGYLNNRWLIESDFRANAIL